MPYQIVRTIQYRSRPELGFFIPFLNSGFINFSTDIQPYYPDITESVYNAEISNMTSLWGKNYNNLNQFFNNTDGLIAFDIVNPEVRTDGITQILVYKDAAAYEYWQNNENIRAANTVGKASINLSEDGSFDASNFILNGIVRTNTATGVSKELAFGQFLTTKFNMLRNTLCTNVHSIVE